MQQHIQQAIVNAVEEKGFYRSPEANSVIDAVSESLAATLDSAIEAFLDAVSVRNPDLVDEARGLFIEVGLAEEKKPEPEVVEETKPEPEVVEETADPRVEVLAKAKADLNEWLEKSSTLIADVRATIAAL